jgi:mannose/cellobiose epimerase-like protein (N-acyl-D-glucosamine 2-epimerase family)
VNFYNSEFLTTHSQSIVDFYKDRCVDNDLGGYFQNYLDDGTTFNNGFRQLVSSTRMVVNFCRAAKLLNNDEYLAIAKHGLDYVEQQHWREESQTYAWTLQDNQPQDMTQQAYGYAFVLLCYAHCYKAGVIDSDAKISEIFKLLESRFWQAEEGIYADTIYDNGRLCDYRGQNANMHICEALIAAYGATQSPRYLEKAQHLATRFCFELSAQSLGLVYEHFTPELVPDLEYNKDDPKNLYRPWGFQPGHQTEWAKLLMQLNDFEARPEFVEKAQTLFDVAYSKAWDKFHGGLVYGFDTEYQTCDSDKYFWVQAESFAAAAMLFGETKQDQYLEQYNALWDYCWTHFVDHEFGAWFRVLTGANQKYSNQKSEAGAKCDYHSLGACFDVLEFSFS